MSGRGGRSSHPGGRGNRNRGGRGRVRGHNYSVTSSTTNRVLCNALGTRFFNYGQKLAADQTRSSWEKLVQYVGTDYGQDISNELQNKLTVNLVELTKDFKKKKKYFIQLQKLQESDSDLSNGNDK